MRAGYIEAIRSANGLKAKMEVYQKIKDADGLDARVTTNMLHSNVTRNGNVRPCRRSGKLKPTADAGHYSKHAADGQVTAEQNANIELLLADAQAEGIQLSVKLLEALLTKLKEKRPNPTNQTLAVLLKDRFWELGSSLDTNIYNILLSLTMRHNNHKTPEVAATMRTSQVYPNEHSYNILIESSTRSRQTSKAMNYLDQMLKMRHQPKVICVLKIIDLCITQVMMQRHGAPHEPHLIYVESPCRKYKLTAPLCPWPRATSQTPGPASIRSRRSPSPGAWRSTLRLPSSWPTSPPGRAS